MLQTKDGCLGLFDGAEFLSAVWVAPPKLNERKNALVQPTQAGEIPLGSEVRASGGRISRATADELVSGGAPKRCGENFVLIQNVVRVGE